MELYNVIFAAIATIVNAGPAQRISNGISVAIEEFPFVASVSTAAGGQHCGGVILTSYYVMTAAHCVQPDLQVRVGSSYRSSGGTLLDVTSVTVHPEYAGGLAANLAVLGLAAPIVFDNGAVAQAPLPSQDTPVVAGVFGFVAGWGSDRPSGEPAEQLAYGMVTTTSLSSCTESYQAVLADTVVCASSDVHYVCPGDAGGPLISSGMVTGVTLSGSCEERDLPGLYTNVAVFSHWLADVATGVPSEKSIGRSGIVVNLLIT